MLMDILTNPDAQRPETLPAYWRRLARICGDLSAELAFRRCADHLEDAMHAHRHGLPATGTGGILIKQSEKESVANDRQILSMGR
jgi:hypothetical protein